jgi:hypothetical protein
MELYLHSYVRHPDVVLKHRDSFTFLYFTGSFVSCPQSTWFLLMGETVYTVRFDVSTTMMFWL